MTLINLTRYRRLNLLCTKRCYVRLFYVVVLCLIVTLFLGVLDLNVYKKYFVATTKNHERPFNLSNYNKFISFENKELSLGHGTIFFRIASLYGIGKQLERRACVERTSTATFNSEFREVFPNMNNYVLLNDCWNKKAKVVDFPNIAWNYVPVNTLTYHASENYIILNAGSLECPEFFHRFRHEIIKMFELSNSVKQKVDNLAKQVFGDDKSPKVCTQIWRRNYFVQYHTILPSTEPFTSKALDYLATMVAEKNGLDKVSLLLLNDDANFTNNVADKVRKNKYIKNIFTVKDSNPIESIGLAARHCDYFLLTSSGLESSWWMAYLLPNEKQKNVFYNSLFLNKHLSYMIKVFREEEFFPPEWNRLFYDVKKDKVSVQDRSIPPILF